MTYEFFIERPKQTIELNLKMVVVNNPNLMNSLDRIVGHTLVRKYSLSLFT